MVIIAQAESRADQRSHECNLLALTQVIESKQKRVASLTKLLENPGMEGKQKSSILNKIMELMNDIQDNEETLQQISQSKRNKSDLIESFLTGTIVAKITKAALAASSTPASDDGDTSD